MRDVAQEDPQSFLLHKACCTGRILKVRRLVSQISHIIEKKEKKSEAWTHGGCETYFQYPFFPIIGTKDQDNQSCP